MYVSYKMTNLQTGRLEDQCVNFCSLATILGGLHASP